MHHVSTLLSVCMSGEAGGGVYVRWGGGGLRWAPCENTAECVYVRWGGGGLRCAPCESSARSVCMSGGVGEV